jgi:hypothetical protein
MTSSATERELEKGELKTGMPALAALRRSTWFVPMQKQPTTSSCRAPMSYPQHEQHEQRTHFGGVFEDTLGDFRL